MKSLLDDNNIAIVIGGGNDQSYCNASALMQQQPDLGNIGVVNIDAHLDARPLLDGNLAHSGSPFRQLLTDTAFNGVFYEFAVQGNQCSAEHAEFVQEHGGSLAWLSKVSLPLKFLLVSFWSFFF